MVVTLDLEGETMAASKIHHTGVFAGTHQDARPFCRKAAEQGSGVAVTAVLRPHHSEHAELSPIGFTSKSTLNLDVILLREPFLAEGGRDIKRLSHRRRLGHSQQVICSQCCRRPDRPGSDPGISIAFNRLTISPGGLPLDPLIVIPILEWIRINGLNRSISIINLTT
jgi:hypothetical protein